MTDQHQSDRATNNAPAMDEASANCTAGSDAIGHRYTALDFAIRACSGAAASQVVDAAKKFEAYLAGN